MIGRKLLDVVSPLTYLFLVYADKNDRLFASWQVGLELPIPLEPKIPVIQREHLHSFFFSVARGVLCVSNFAKRRFVCSFGISLQLEMNCFLSFRTK